MIFKLTRTGLVLSLLFLSIAVKAQISHGGEPLFKYAAAKSNPVELSKFKAISKSIIESDRNFGVKLKHAQYAYSFNVDYNIEKDGVWEELIDGRRVWRFSVKSEGAYSLGVEFSEFRIPFGAQLFVYNDQSNKVLGSYTHENNKNSGKFSIEPLKGDELTIEYIEPSEVEFPAELAIETILHDYKNVFNLLKGSNVKASGECNVDINCPEGNGWQTEKRSVCHILYNGWIASGALVNNTRQDGTPYLLTAYHVIHEQEVADAAIFYFNYENSECGGNDGEKSQSISGSTLRATTSNLDFTLLELSVQPPLSYSPYYAGWDRSGRVPVNTTCIHHPSGDAKKISLDIDAPVTATYSDARYTFDENTSWQILNWEVGTTEGGSSGSPLFDENHRIIGDLTGGDASCGNSVNDYYAKFSESWANYSNINEQLKHWLDPMNFGVETLNGYDPSFKINASSKCVGNDFTVEAIVNEGAENMQWDFGEDATPTQAVGPGPHNVSYSSVGNKSIQLSYRSNGVDIDINRDVKVVDLTKLSFDYTIQKRKLTLINQSVDFDSFTWNLGDENTSDEFSPSHEYLNYGEYTVSLTGTNDCGSTSTSKQIEMNYDKLLSVYPNPSVDKFTVDLSKIIYSEISWSVYSSTGMKVRNGVTPNFSNTLEFNLKGLSAGMYILRMNVDGEILKRKLLLVK
ncbi:PKD domain-containing protein [Marinifilum sp. D714]|uniref:T9SS type A sorting domain-containing protein n=1 Tax=Marinifilum sp. D714 TaxID=2937523 RepID=UPI0027BDF0D1|nr:PKD domain-containing protein [Marinifilum sp. D714]MDQ2179025.1 PKD domain-containing protein [Marinifilum sp. D714]